MNIIHNVTIQKIIYVSETLVSYVQLLLKLQISTIYANVILFVKSHLIEKYNETKTNSIAYQVKKQKSSFITNFSTS